MAKIFIAGTGFGLSLAIGTQRIGHSVTLWSAFPQDIETLVRDGENKRLLPGIPIPKGIGLTASLEELPLADVVLFAIPTGALREVAGKFKAFISKEAVLVNVGKGLEEGTMFTMSQVLEAVFPENKIVVLTGPCHAEEVGRGMPTTVVAASKDKESALYIQEILSSGALRIYINDDLLGCELGGALKNIIALCAGICDGMGFGDNTKAALMTRGMTEITRLGVAMGAKSDTFAGLAGMGDLIVTCTSMHSRNRRAGILIGKGLPPEQAVEQVGTVEGYFCAKVAFDLAKKLSVPMPITEQLHEVLWGGKSVHKALTELMERPSKAESEHTFTQTD